MVFQGYALFPHMTVRQNIAYPLEVRKGARDEIVKRVDEMLELVQLETFGDRLPRQLSGGQQQRVALARALIFDPLVLLLDEPLGALDKKLRSNVQTQLKHLHRKVGKTFVYVTHDQEEALSFALAAHELQPMNPYAISALIVVLPENDPKRSELEAKLKSVTAI